MAKAMSRSLASSRRRCVSARLRFSVCAESVYMALASSSATMVNTTASSVSVKPRARLGAERDEPVIERAVALVLLEAAKPSEIGVFSAIEEIGQGPVGPARIDQAAAGQREHRALAGQADVSLDGHADARRARTVSSGARRV